jgi:branched-chain amino acid transport system substrate-binding protein
MTAPRLAALAAVLALTAAACGGSGPGAASQASPAATAPAAPDTAAAPADLSDRTILLGLTTSLSGEAAVAGISIENATRMAIDEVNDSGGIFGARLDLAVEDTQFNPSEEIPAVQKLVDQVGVDLMVGPITGRSLKSGGPIALDAGLVVINAHASEGGLEALGDSLIYLAPTEPFLAEVTAQRILAAHSPATAVLSFDGGDEFSIASKDSYRRVFEAAGVEILEEVQFASDSADFSPVARAVSTHRPDVVTIAAFPEIQGTVTRAVRAAGFSGPIGCASNGCNSGDYTAVAGEAAAGSYTSAAYDPEGETAREVRRRYEEAFPDDPFTPFVFNQYDAVMLLAEALRQVGAEHLFDGDELNSAAVVEAFTSGDVTFAGARGSQRVTEQRTLEFDEVTTFVFEDVGGTIEMVPVD